MWCPDIILTPWICEQISVEFFCFSPLPCIASWSSSMSEEKRNNCYVKQSFTCSIVVTFFNEKMVLIEKLLVWIVNMVSIYITLISSWVVPVGVAVMFFLVQEGTVSGKIIFLLFIFYWYILFDYDYIYFFLPLIISVCHWMDTFICSAMRCTNNKSEASL